MFKCTSCNIITQKWSLFLFTTTLFFITFFLYTDIARAVTLFPDIVTQGESGVTSGTKSVDLSTCKENKDCPNASVPFCLYNTTTKKNQCFSQSVILTDMSTIYSDTPKYMSGVSACGCTSAGTLGSGDNDKIICTNVNKTYPKVTCKPISGKDTATIAKKLQENKPVIFSCHKCVGTTENGKSKSYKGHFMVATGISADGNSFTVLDVDNKGADRNITLINMKEFLDGRIGNAYVIEGVK